MSFAVAIDISTFIWCEEDYNANRDRYYNLLTIAPSIYEKISELKLPLLLKKELCESIMIEFPYNMINEISYEFQHITLSFLTTTDWYPYLNNEEKSVKSSPILVKEYFSDNIQKEAQSQVCHLFYNGDNPEHKFIAYEYFFNQNNNLVLSKHDQNTEIDTLCYNSENDIIKFFNSYKIRFRHNPKHDRYKSGGIVSPLSCYNDRTQDVTKAQELLEKAYRLGDDFYCFDEENNVYVQFVSSNDGTYHGFDVSDERNNIPSVIKNKFNKNGRVF
ncbi:hypothetical protein [Chryseobacterium gambrini]|uniref:DUF4935 domain-containing protein n=1 Tax=Chryseobacterium gambrini TaxID=373672 RepID=A0ABN7CHP3_9FLAO|nr:hypothetical protein CRDW_33180 [Chryseobacterium gambrini]